MVEHKKYLIILFKKSFTFVFDSWSTDRKRVDTQLKHQVDIGKAQKINIPKYLIVANQTTARIGVPNKAKKLQFLII